MSKVLVMQVPTYVKALETAGLRGSELKSCLTAELADIIGDVVYFRNYKDTDLEYIEYSFTRLGNNKAKFNYVSYVEYDALLHR